MEIIKSLQNKATGPSSIPLKLLHIVADLIVFPLCHIINMSFSKGIFPEKLKIVKVIPIHKGGSTPDINNCRPISLLSIFDKIIEKMMHRRLYDFLEHHSILLFCYQQSYIVMGAFCVHTYPFDFFKPFQSNFWIMLLFYLTDYFSRTIVSYGTQTCITMNLDN